MKFTPVSEKDANSQASAIGLWPAGDYDFEVRDASEEESQAGNDMFKLEVWIFNTEGRRRLCFDYLVNSEKAAWKIRHFAESCGLLKEYESGSLTASEMIGRNGRCKVGVRPAQNGYEARNDIRAYLKDERASSSRPRKTVATDLDDEIPF